MNLQTLGFDVYSSIITMAFKKQNTCFKANIFLEVLPHSFQGQECLLPQTQSFIRRTEHLICPHQKLLVSKDLDQIC